MKKAGNITYEEAESDYIRVHKSIIRNSKIDCLTLGIYVKIITLSKDWNLNIKGLSTILNISDAKVRASISILEKEGYITRHAVKGDKGKFIGWDYKIFSKPTSDITSAGQRTCSKSDTPLNGQDQEPTTPKSDKTEIRGENNIRYDNDLYTSKYKDKDIYKEDIDKSIPKKVFENFRKSYQGTKRGLEVEFKNFTKHKDWKEVLPLLGKALEREITHRNNLLANNQFCPCWAHLSTWINQRRWEQEFESVESQQKEKDIVKPTLNMKF